MPLPSWSCQSLAKIIISCIRNQQSLEKINFFFFWIKNSNIWLNQICVVCVVHDFFHLSVNATLFPLGVNYTRITHPSFYVLSLSYKTSPVNSRYHKGKQKKKKQPLCVTNIKQWQSDQHHGMLQKMVIFIQLQLSAN